MWRAFFLASGFCCCLFGAELLVTDRLILNSRLGGQRVQNGYAPVRVQRKEYVPPDFLPWTLLSTGSIIILYALTLPKDASAPVSG